MGFNLAMGIAYLRLELMRPFYQSFVVPVGQLLGTADRLCKRRWLASDWIRSSEVVHYSIMMIVCNMYHFNLLVFSLYDLIV